MVAIEQPQKTMRPPHQKKTRDQQLRVAAEAQLGGTSPNYAGQATELHHELQIRQIELEMQNETLRRAQMALEESRDRYVDLYELAPVGYLTLTDQGLIVEINLHGASLLGLERRRLPVQFSRFVAKEDAACWHLHLDRALKRDDELECDLALQRKDGSRIHVRLRSCRLTSNVSPPVLRMVLTDQTEHYKTTEALRKAQLFANEVERLSKLGGWKYEVATGQVTWTPGVYRIYGVGMDYDPNDIANDISFYSGKDQKTISDAFTMAVRNGKAYDLELEFIAHDGTHRWVRTTGHPEIRNGKVVSITGNISDVTERKQMEIALANQAELLERTGEMAKVGGWELNLSTMRVTWSSETARLHEVDPPYVAPLLDTGRQWYPPEVWPIVEAAVKAAIESGKSYDLELPFMTAKGRHIWVRVQGFAVMDGGKTTKLRGTFQDITERKMKESELRSLRTELQHILDWQITRHTAAALAHEINQPLASISALCEALRRMIVVNNSSNIADDAWSKSVEENLLRISIESERAGSAVHHLLHSLRKPDTVVEKASLSAILIETLSIGQSDGLPKDGVLIECPIDLPPVLVNRLQLEKVLLNLISNGLEAMRDAGNPQGRVRISTGVTEDGTSALVTVSDCGPGVSSDIQAQIFHPFVTTKAYGIGMGLAISRALVEGQGGKLWHEPQDGPGATFRFTVPFSR